MSPSNSAGARHFHTEAWPGHGLKKYLAPQRLRRVYLILLGGLPLLGLAPVAWAQNASTDGAVTVEISKESATLTAGEWVAFETMLRNGGATPTPPLAAHLSIAALAKGKHVDPEDWSPQRTQYLPPLQPGASVQLRWKLHTLFEGAFASFVTVVSAEESFPPALSSPLRLQVAPDNILPLKEVIPVVAVVPFFPLALLLFMVVYTRRR
jgi:hypothetical protein